MRQVSVLTVLMFLFKYHMEDSCELNATSGELVEQLQDVGFNKGVIYAAFDWLANLAEQTAEPVSQPSPHSMRAYSEYESSLLDMECRRLLITLEQIGILTPMTREMVIHQLLELADEEINSSLVKWVTLMVLFNNPNESQALKAMEFLVLDTTTNGIH